MSGGTGIGKSARIFHETCKHFKINSEIHSIDLPGNAEHVEHPREKRGKLVKGIKKVNLYQGDGLKVSLEIYNRIKKKKVVPLFFCDGDHEYRSVKRELETIIKSVPNANIFIHDTFYQSSNSGYNIDPYQAVQKLLKSLPKRYKLLETKTGLPGMTLLYQ